MDELLSRTLNRLADNIQDIADEIRNDDITPGRMATLGIQLEGYSVLVGFYKTVLSEPTE